LFTQKPWGKIEGSSLTPLNDETLTLSFSRKRKAEVITLFFVKKSAITPKETDTKII